MGLGIAQSLKASPLFASITNDWTFAREKSCVAIYSPESLRYAWTLTSHQESSSWLASCTRLSLAGRNFFLDLSRRA